METVTDQSLLNALNKWEEHAREYFADMKVGLLELNTVPHCAKKSPRQRERRRRNSSRSSKIVNIVQWVRVEKHGGTQVPSDQSLASRSVVKPTCKTSNGSTKLSGTRTQAVR